MFNFSHVVPHIYSAAYSSSTSTSLFKYRSKLYICTEYRFYKDKLILSDYADYFKYIEFDLCFISLFEILLHSLWIFLKLKITIISHYIV